ncbi:hypothetical protein PR048_021218 [Dryococelus australis]|uniref:Uncharacterized protein n=1 Tax=Dryococelus australis TaxID=614101 RepID=A0ABQ9GXS3_9NEOP|nr:hypothetical protein PR048_021218 [Dryococelus australis]
MRFVHPLATHPRIQYCVASDDVRRKRKQERLAAPREGMSCDLSLPRLTPTLTTRQPRHYVLLSVVSWLVSFCFVELEVPSCSDAICVGMQGRGKQEISEKARLPAASSITIAICENTGVAGPGIEPAISNGSYRRRVCMRDLRVKFQRCLPPFGSSGLPGANRRDVGHGSCISAAVCSSSDVASAKKAFCIVVSSRTGTNLREIETEKEQDFYLYSVIYTKEMNRCRRGIEHKSMPRQDSSFPFACGSRNVSRAEARRPQKWQKDSYLRNAVGRRLAYDTRYWGRNGNESAMAFVRDPFHHLPGVISENHGKPKSGWPNRESIPGKAVTTDTRRPLQTVCGVTGHRQLCENVLKMAPHSCRARVVAILGVGDNFRAVRLRNPMWYRTDFGARRNIDRARKRPEDLNDGIKSFSCNLCAFQLSEEVNDSKNRTILHEERRESRVTALQRVFKKLPCSDTLKISLHTQHGENHPRKFRGLRLVAMAYPMLVTESSVPLSLFSASNANRVQTPPGRFTPDFRKLKSCRTMLLVGGFPRRSPVSCTLFIPALHHIHLPHFILVCSQDLNVKSRPKLFIHSFTNASKKRALAFTDQNGRAAIIPVKWSVVWRGEISADLNIEALRTDANEARGNPEKTRRQAASSGTISRMRKNRFAQLDQINKSCRKETKPIGGQREVCTPSRSLQLQTAMSQLFTLSRTDRGCIKTVQLLTVQQSVSESRVKRLYGETPGMNSNEYADFSSAHGFCLLIVTRDFETCTNAQDWLASVHEGILNTTEEFGDCSEQKVLQLRDAETSFARDGLLTTFEILTTTRTGEPAKRGHYLIQEMTEAAVGIQRGIADVERMEPLEQNPLLWKEQPLYTQQTSMKQFIYPLVHAQLVDASFFIPRGGQCSACRIEHIAVLKPPRETVHSYAQFHFKQRFPFHAVVATGSALRSETAMRSARYESRYVTCQGKQDGSNYQTSRGNLAAPGEKCHDGCRTGRYNGSYGRPCTSFCEVWHRVIGPPRARLAGGVFVYPRLRSAGELWAICDDEMKWGKEWRSKLINQGRETVEPRVNTTGQMETFTTFLTCRNLGTSVFLTVRRP